MSTLNTNRARSIAPLRAHAVRSTIGVLDLAILRSSPGVVGHLRKCFHGIAIFRYSLDVLGYHKKFFRCLRPSQEILSIFGAILRNCLGVLGYLRKFFRCLRNENIMPSEVEKIIRDFQDSCYILTFKNILASLPIPYQVNRYLTKQTHTFPSTSTPGQVHPNLAKYTHTLSSTPCHPDLARYTHAGLVGDLHCML